MIPPHLPRLAAVAVRVHARTHTLTPVSLPSPPCLYPSPPSPPCLYSSPPHPRTLQSLSRGR